MMESKINHLTKDFILIINSLIAIFISNLIGHFIVPISIQITPILIGVILWNIIKKCHFHLLIKTVIIILLILLNDILIRLYNKGIHDFEGNGWIVLFFFVGLFVFGLCLIAYGFINKEIKWTIISLIISSLVFYFYLLNFGTLGMIWENDPSENISISKKNKIFVSEYSLNDSLIIYNIDTFKIKSAWIEKEMQINNSSFKKTYNPNNKYLIIILLNGNFNEYGFNSNVYYQINKTSKCIEKTNIISTYDILSYDTLNIDFTDINKNKLIKKISLLLK